MTLALSRAPTSDTPIDRLSRLQAPAPTMVSCYLRLDPAARENRAFLVELLNRIRRLEMTFEVRGLSVKQVGQVKSDLDRIIRWLAVPANLPNTPGIALFASSQHRLFEAIPLARVHRNRLDVDTKPLLLGPSGASCGSGSAERRPMWSTESKLGFQPGGPPTAPKKPSARWPGARSDSWWSATM